MSQTTQKLTNEQLADMPPWQIADAIGIGYDGDINPVEHGGFFYDFRDWERWGYANAVEFWEDPETHALVVQTGTIHKPNDMTATLLHFGAELADEERNNIHFQISACKAHISMQCDGTEYTYLKTFNPDHWRKEKNIWKSIRGWIEALGA